MSDQINHERRRFLASAAMTIAAARLGSIDFANAEQSKSTNKSFDALKLIDAGLLNVGYAEAGPPNGRPVILLHGWPYDIHSFVDVTPLLPRKVLLRNRNTRFISQLPITRPSITFNHWRY